MGSECKTGTDGKIVVPRYVWVALAVFLACAAADHLMIAGIYGLDFKHRVTHGDAAP